MSRKPIRINETLTDETLTDVEKLQELDRLCKQCKSQMEGPQTESIQRNVEMACDSCSDLRASLPTLLVLAAEASG